jgi:hypothetical protein
MRQQPALVRSHLGKDTTVIKEVTITNFFPLKLKGSLRTVPTLCGEGPSSQAVGKDRQESTRELRVDGQW